MYFGYIHSQEQTHMYTNTLTHEYTQKGTHTQIPNPLTHNIYTHRSMDLDFVHTQEHTHTYKHAKKKHT